jgi:YVTN family beta-propeller protein
MSTGVLAIQSQLDGVLFVDGQRVQPLTPGNIITLSLTAGGHFVDLRDQNGTKLWQKIIEVPAGAQAAVNIETQKQPQSTELPSAKTNSAGPTGAEAAATGEPHPSKLSSKQAAAGRQDMVLTVPVGSKPSYLAINAATNKTYVLNRDSITIIDGATNTTTTVAAGTKPYSLAIDSSTNKLYVANFASNDVTVIDGAGNTVTMPVGIRPEQPVINSITHKVYVPNDGSDSVTVIDGRKDKMHTVQVCKSPSRIAVNQVTNMIYVSCGDNSLRVIDGTRDRVSASIDNVVNTYLAIDSDNNLIYTGGMRMLFDRDEVLRLDFSRFSPDPKYRLDPWKDYVDNFANRIPANVIDGRSNTRQRYLTIGNPSASVDPMEKGVEGVDSVVINPVTHKVYLALNRSTSKRESGAKPMITRKRSAHVFEVDALPDRTQQLVEVMAESDMFFGDIAVNPVTNKLYLANYDGDDVFVIDGTTHVNTKVRVGNKPSHITVDPAKNIIYVINKASDSVSVIDGATNATTTIPVGKKPSQIAVNQVTDKIYISNEASDSVTVLDGATLTIGPK